MTTSINLPYSYDVYANNTGWTNTSGYLTEITRDDRSALVKTPQGRWRPPTSYARFIESGRCRSYDAQYYDRYHFKGYPWYEVGQAQGAGSRNCSGYYYVPLDGPPSNWEDRAIIKARLKLKNTKINLAQNFGERAQTARLLKDSLVSLADMVDNVRRLKPGRAIRHPEEWFFNRWLELQYGWKPLISDCYGAVAALHDKERETAPGIRTVKALVSGEETQITLMEDYFSANHWTFERVRKVKHKVFVRLDFVQDENPLLLKELSQLGITNPLNLAWELLPWSFVADWFIPVGDYLDSLDATIGWTFKGGSVSRKSTCEVSARRAQMIELPDVYDERSKNISVEGSGYQMNFSRTAYTSAPLPAVPDLHKITEASGLHIANGIALLMSAILGGKAKVR